MYLTFFACGEIEKCTVFLVLVLNSRNVLELKPRSVPFFFVLVLKSRCVPLVALELKSRSVPPLFVLVRKSRSVPMFLHLYNFCHFFLTKNRNSTTHPSLGLSALRQRG